MINRRFEKYSLNKKHFVHCSFLGVLYLIIYDVFFSLRHDNSTNYYTYIQIIFFCKSFCTFCIRSVGHHIGRFSRYIIPEFRLWRWFVHGKGLDDGTRASKTKRHVSQRFLRTITFRYFEDKNTYLCVIYVYVWNKIIRKTRARRLTRWYNNYVII